MYRKLTIAPCKKACPAGVDVPRYLRLIAAGQYANALSVIRASLPLPAVCGYVCPGPCEDMCHLAHAAAAPEAIRTLKRFVTDQASGDWPQQRGTQPTGRRVAIVGSGPAGLTAAYYLAQQGHQPTVYEALSEAGGMMRVGIPAYRLPREILDAEIEAVKKAGVEIKTDTRIESLDGLLAQGYDAVFLALGAHRGVRLGIDGEDSPGVFDALSFLRQVSTGNWPTVGTRVAVIGGGNSAVDAARTALRLGAQEVTIVYRRTNAEMRAYREEIQEALREGVKIVAQTIPSCISIKDGCLRMECLRTTSSNTDTRLLPRPITGSEFTVEAETVIVAVGQETEIPQGFSISLKGSNILIDPENMSTAKTGIFAGADCVTGPKSVIEAIAAGKHAAMAIDRYLGGPGVISEKLVLPEDKLTQIATHYPPPTAIGSEIPLLSVNKRFSGFPLVELPLSPEVAVHEASRCLKCDLPIVIEAAKCRSCFVCQLVCSLRFEGAFNPSKAFISILPMMKSDGDVEIGISFDEQCDSCGLCVRYCPFGALTKGYLGESAERKPDEKQGTAILTI